MTDKLEEIKQTANKYSKAITNIDTLITTHYESIQLYCQMRLHFTIKQHFPKVEAEGGKFLVISKKDYARRWYSEFKHTGIAFKGIPVGNFNKLVDAENILIGERTTNSYGKITDWVEVEHFELPKNFKNFITITGKNETQKDNDK